MSLRCPPSTLPLDLMKREQRPTVKHRYPVVPRIEDSDAPHHSLPRQRVLLEKKSRMHTYIHTLIPDYHTGQPEAA